MYGGGIEQKLDEDSPFDPKSPYAVSKLFAHDITKVYRDSYDLYGVNGKEPIWGDKFIEVLSQSSMGLNLSRGKAVKYYSSDRIVQLMGNGLLTFIDKNTFYGDFFTNKEIITYNNIDDLSYKLNKYKKDIKERKIIAKNGRNKYIKFFNSKLICEFIIDKTFGFANKKKFLWEK